MKPKPAKTISTSYFTDFLVKCAKKYPVPLLPLETWWKPPYSYDWPEFFPKPLPPSAFWDRVDRLDMTKPNPK